MSAIRPRLSRSVDRWRQMSPKAVSEGSSAQNFYALQDAQHDIAVLAEALGAVNLWINVNYNREPVPDSVRTLQSIILSAMSEKP